MSRVIAILPARGGSKGLPGKNVLPVGGKPLIAHSVEHAVQSGVCDRVLITTDSEEIRDAAVAAGAWAPFLRDPSLAEDLTPTEPVLKDALERAEAVDGPFDIVVFLQPTDIFRDPAWITRAVTLLKERPELESVFAAYKTHKNFWYRTPEGELKRVFDWMAVYGPRQTRTPIYREDTGLACASRSDLIRSGRRIGDRVEIVEVTDTASGIDIHDAFDLWLADQAYRYLKEKGGR
ncbi:cytidylyltransferase domain-containing protein [Azospirillum halopraeferens]|uniref:acylneuraminate cytidylyltransferase family protein n=1 Tax=Azospirillum halopraeferens TaxID=34010 RepID=UPI000404CED2|nr:acylneuraminate cytidylyltransferase family protein [Azospirillum halopraeferens]